jgi:RNA-directed DNA polymerase
MKQKFISDLFQAYYDARKNKRSTINALKFEYNYESNLLVLSDEILFGRYEVGRSVAFIVNKPVKREIFAADFRDRVVHHLIFNYINPIFERKFIYDSYSCRTGKGTLFGIKRASGFTRSCSRNYKKDCYVLKLDISGYFMAIDKKILFKEIEKNIFSAKQCRFKKELVMELIEKVIFNNPTKNCIIKGSLRDWEGLPKNKSLFFSQKDKGLSIGNLTSQLFANIYLNKFDHFIKRDLGIKYYGRYVDDFFLIHQDKDYLKKTMIIIIEYLKKNLNLSLHPNKIYLQHCSRGFDFLGVYIKPYRIYIKNKVKSNIKAKINEWELAFNNGELGENERKKIITSANSYLGLSSHFNTYRLRKKITDNLSQIGFQNDEFCKKIY